MDVLIKNRVWWTQEYILSAQRNSMGGWFWSDYEGRIASEC